MWVKNAEPVLVFNLSLTCLHRAELLGDAIDAFFYISVLKTHTYKNTAFQLGKTYFALDFFAII